MVIIYAQVVAVLVDAWESCQGAEVLLESPSAMAGVHIAEALSGVVAVAFVLFD